MSKQCGILKRKVWPNSSVTVDVAILFHLRHTFCYCNRNLIFLFFVKFVFLFFVFFERIEWRLVCRTSTTFKLTNDVVCQKTFGFNEPLPKKCWSSRLVRDWKWQLTDVGSQTLNPSVLPVKHFDIWRGLGSFSFNFLRNFIYRQGGYRRRKMTSFPKEEDDGRWLTTTKKNREEPNMKDYFFARVL